eukprot:1255206-Rhodomonas_salina.1
MAAPSPAAGRGRGLTEPAWKSAQVCCHALYDTCLGCSNRRSAKVSREKLRAQGWDTLRANAILALLVGQAAGAVSYTHLRAHETEADL